MNCEDKLDECPALITSRVIAGKWKTRILWLLRQGQMQFGELRRQLKGISAKMLTEHLRQLEADGLIRRTESLRGGVKITFYAYTDYGITLVPVLDSMGRWGLLHQQR